MRFKFLRPIITLLLCQFILLMFASTSYASSSTNLPPWTENRIKNDDYNYVRVGIQQGYTSYINLKTITVLEYAPPIYRIKASIVTFNPEEKFSRESSVTWRYVWSEYESDRRMFYLSNNAWQEISISSMESATAAYIAGGEIAWYVSYQIDFYGNPYRVD